MRDVVQSLLWLPRRALRTAGNGTILLTLAHRAVIERTQAPRPPRARFSPSTLGLGANLQSEKTNGRKGSHWDLLSKKLWL